jgi:Na+-driven multidrug efflux pump
MLNLLLIPKYSLNGAAFATVITEFFGFLIYIYFASRFLKLKKNDLISLFKFSKDDVKYIKKRIF